MEKLENLTLPCLLNYVNDNKFSTLEAFIYVKRSTVIDVITPVVQHVFQSVIKRKRYRIIEQPDNKEAIEVMIADLSDGPLHCSITTNDELLIQTFK